jgi:FkbM family methyltransferase
MGSALYWTGFHEFREFVFLHRFLKPDMVFVDVGANMGEYTLFAAKRLIKGKVLSFEPLPSIRDVFIENIKLNGFKNIEVYPFGLSAQEEILEIHEFEDVHEGLATLYPGNRRSKASVKVQLKKFDDIARQAGLSRIDFIKVDIEGGELKAIRGCAGVVEQYRPVFMIEINAETYQTAGYAPADVMDVFSRWNYLPHQIKKRGLLERCTALPDFGNVLFIPQ